MDDCFEERDMVDTSELPELFSLLTLNLSRTGLVSIESLHQKVPYLEVLDV